MPDNKTDNITEGSSGLGDIAGIKGAVALVYRTLASTRASVFILCSMALLFLAGAISSHGGMAENIPDGERFVFLAGGQGLSVLFSSPLFLPLYLALFVNLVAGAYNRVKSTRSSPGGPLERTTPTHTISLTQNGAEATTDIRRALESELGFRVKTSGDYWVVMEKGLPYSYLIWAYNAAMAICLAGIAITLLFASERTVTLTQGLPIAIETVESAMAAPVGLRLVSGPFTARYTERAESIDHESLISKLIASIRQEWPAYEMRAGALYPVDWRLDITVVDGGAAVMEKVMGPGDPLRYAGYTFYLQSLDQTFRVRVDENPLTLSARNNDELLIPGIGAGLGLPVRFSIFKKGTLERIDGSMERISPHTSMKLSGVNNSGEDLGRVSPGESIHINGTRLTLADVTENFVLRYRHDPGTTLLLWGGVLLIVTAALRLFGPWQMAAYRVDYTSPIVRLHLHIASKGLLASSSRLFKKLERIMTTNDIRPIPLPGGRLK